eukprot:s1576_g11.t1
MEEGINDELLHVACEMGNRAVEMMVDTGAQTSVISMPLVRTLGLESRLDSEDWSRGICTGAWATISQSPEKVQECLIFGGADGVEVPFLPSDSRRRPSYRQAGCPWRSLADEQKAMATSSVEEALVSRIVRADVSLPDNITNEYPEASRCTRAMLRQQPDRRPSAMSLLNRPRLQPPTYELPGMQPESTRDTKLFDPPSRDHRDRDHRDRDHRELGSRPRHLGEPVPNGAKAAFSPRTNVRTKLANQVDESDEKYGIHQYVTHKGIIDDAIGRPRQTGTTGTSGTTRTQARPTYPASPVIIPSNGSETRTGSREAGSARSFGQPLSARPKAYQAQQQLQRSPRSPGPADHTEHGAGTRSSSTPRSPCEDRSSKFQHRREERCRQSQAFRQWLREQRAKGKESPGPMADSSQSPIQEESSPCEFSPQSVVATPTESAGEPGDKLNESRETACSRSPASPSQPRLRKPKISQPRQEWRTEIYCPGFPVITVEDEAAEEPQGQLEPSRSLSAVPEHGQHGQHGQHGTSPEEKQSTDAAEPTPRGPADVGGTPADTMEVVVQKLVTEADNMTFEIEASDTHPFVDQINEGQAEGKLAMRSRLCGSPDTSKVEVKQECLGLPKDLDDSKKSVSIGDRIEGIRACLEARMGTHRFQKLYKSLTKDDSVANNLSGSSVSWPRDSSMFLPEDIDEAFVGAGDGGSDDINSLIPLVAKLVQMPRYSDFQSWIGGLIEILFFADYLLSFTGLSVLRSMVLKVDEKINEFKDKVEMKVLGSSSSVARESQATGTELRQRRKADEAAAAILAEKETNGGLPSSRVLRRK